MFQKALSKSSFSFANEGVIVYFIFTYVNFQALTFDQESQMVISNLFFCLVSNKKLTICYQHFN